jgi:flagellar motor switch protein FliM
LKNGIFKDNALKKNQLSPIRKEIFFPSMIGDWTTYTSEKNQESISITKSVGTSNKTVSQQIINNLLFVHQEFFQTFFDKVTQKINTHIELERISINISNHRIFKESLDTDIYQCKFSFPELEQIDFIFSKKTTKIIAHRLCGGNTPPQEISAPTELEISLTSVLNPIFIHELSKQWRNIFPADNHKATTTFGHYRFHPQQSENDTIIELEANFKLLNLKNQSCKIIYSLETIEKLLSLNDLLNSNIQEKTQLTNATLKNTLVTAVSILGKTTLALSEIQTIEIGDVILLEHHKVTDPIQLIIGNTVVFNATPIKINDKELGVQILNTPAYDNYKQETAKPSAGPLIADAPPSNPPEKQTQPSQQSQYPQETQPDQEDIFMDTSNPDESDDDDFVELPSQPPLSTEDERSDLEDSDFSWDDLDDE